MWYWNVSKATVMQVVIQDVILQLIRSEIVKICRINFLPVTRPLDWKSRSINSPYHGVVFSSSNPGEAEPTSHLQNSKSGRGPLP